MLTMKKLILLFCSLFAFVSIFAQETERFQILKIRKVKNDCYRLTAKSNGKKYTIYSHYNAENNADGEKIKCRDILDIKIYPFFSSKLVSVAEFKQSFGLEIEDDDYSRFAEVTMPFNYQSITVDYYGNFFKIKKKMYYYTLDINGLYKCKRQNQE